MSHFLDRLTFFRKNVDTFADSHGVVTNEDRALGGRLPQALAARQDRALHPRRELHRLVLVEDLRQGRHRHLGDAADRLSAHPPGPAEPRAARLCARRQLFLVPLLAPTGVKHPMVRGRLLKLWREARATTTPVAAWASHRRGPGKARELHQQARPRRLRARDLGRGRTRSSPPPTPTRSRPMGPDRVIGFSPIPAMSMVSLRRRRRYLSLLGGVCLSFYDWYCDLPPASPMTWGEQTDVPESADWYNAGFLMLWGSQRPADPHAGRAFLHRGPLQGHQVGGRSRPDYAEATKFADLWLHPEAGHRRGAGAGDGPRHPARIPSRPQRAVFRTTTAPLHRPADAGPPGAARAGATCPTACCAPRISPDVWARRTTPPGRPWRSTTPAHPVVPLGSVGFRWGEQGKWNLEARSAAALAMSLRADAGRRRRRPPRWRSPISAAPRPTASPQPTIPTC